MFTFENVQKAVLEFYYSLEARNDAHEWLTRFQSSTEAWSICWNLLNSDQYEVKFFGASTLQMKVSKHWQQLPENQVEVLKNKIFECILNNCAGLKVISTRLCIVLSVYIVQTISEKWKTAIVDLISTFNPKNFPNQPAENIVEVLIETLTVLPEEFLSFALLSFNRGLVRNALQAGVTHILPVVVNVLSNPYPQRLRLQAIKCFSSWIQLGIPLPECESIISLLLASTADEELFDSALDCLTNVCCHPDVYKYSESLQKLFALILHLEPLLSRYLNNKEFDKCYNIYSLFVNVGETHCELLLDNVVKKDKTCEITMRLVAIILQCAACPGKFPIEEHCSSLTFNFWYILQDEIYSTETVNSNVLRQYFVPVYLSLVETLIIKSVLPTDEEKHSWNLDDHEVFRCYRQDIADTLMYCYNLLREQMLQKLFSHFQYLIMQLKAGNLSVSNMLEANLHAFEAISENVDGDENTYIPQMLYCLPEVLNCDIKVANGILNIIGAYAGWIRYHPDTLNFITPLMLFGLKNPKLVVSATRALKEISRDCQNSLKPFAKEILEECKMIISNPGVHSNEKIRLMCTVGRLLSTLTIEETMSYLSALLTPYVMELQQLSDSRHTAVEQMRVSFIINMLAVLAVNLDTKPSSSDESEGEMQCNFSDRPQPLVIVLQQLMPIIQEVTSKWIENAIIIEEICDLLKKCVSTLLDDALPVMRDVLKLITNLFKQKPRPSIMDLVKQFLLLFGNDENCVVDLRLVLLTMINTTLETLKFNFAEHTDLVQGFLQTLMHVIKKTKILLHPDFDLTPLFHCGIIAMSLPESPTMKAASSFLVTFITQSAEVPSSSNNPATNSQPMSLIVESFGESLVEICLKLVGGSAPRGVMDNVAEVFLALNKYYFSKLCQWMTTFLHRENFPSPRVSQAEKENYTRQILKERVNKRKLQEVIKEYSLACRGLIGTEYGAQTMPFL